jgi:Fe-S-cluster containining protein
MWPLVAWLRICWWASQLLDGYVQAGLKRLFGGTRYERTGACIRSGTCCELIAMEPPRLALRRPRLLASLLRLGEVLYPFRYERMDDGMALYTCHNFDRERRVCLNYRFRPRICREYPPVPIYGRLYFNKGCGFSMRLRGRRNSFIEILDSKRREPTVAEPSVERHPTPQV